MPAKLNQTEFQLVAYLRHEKSLGEMAEYLSRHPECLRETPGLQQLLSLYRLYREKSLVDPLTELTNRRGFDDELKKLVGHTQRQRKQGINASLSLAIYDVNDFKNINDTYGHPAGDEALRLVATVLDMSYQRGLETRARIGGDEFAAIQPEPKEKALVTAETVAKAIQEYKVNGLTVEVSLGVAEWQDGMGPEKLFDEADKALYGNKAEKRNRRTR